MQLSAELDGCDSIDQRAGLVHQVVDGEPWSAPQQRGGRAFAGDFVDVNEIDLLAWSERQLIFGRANEGEVTVSFEMSDGSVQQRSVRTWIASAPGRCHHDHVVPLLELRCDGEGPVGQRVDAGSPGECVCEPTGRRTDGEHGRHGDRSETLDESVRVPRCDRDEHVKIVGVGGGSRSCTTRNFRETARR